MSLNTIHLRKVLRFCMLDDERALSALRREAYEDRRRVEFPREGGGDFFGPFWSDAKGYACHQANLQSATDARIESNDRRARLYPILCSQFIRWWREFERAINERLIPIDESINGRLEFSELAITLKVDNLLCFRLDRERHRIIYPYFSEAPILNPYWARVGLWGMHQVLSDYRIEDMVLLDVQRGKSFSTREIDLRGDEEQIFLRRASQLLEIWNRILDEAA